MRGTLVGLFAPLPPEAQDKKNPGEWAWIIQVCSRNHPPSHEDMKCPWCEHEWSRSVTRNHTAMMTWNNQRSVHDLAESMIVSYPGWELDCWPRTTAVNATRWIPAFRSPFCISESEISGPNCPLSTSLVVCLAAMPMTLEKCNFKYIYYTYYIFA